ncbi:hypothetical protein TNCV_4832061 [Trichonephila clavipes]|nr:hypothetical protein TNCV_4832061 [Trichonephila clavipes]
MSQDHWDKLQEVLEKRLCSFTRAFKEINIYYRSHYSCLYPQRSMEHFTNNALADIHLIFGLAEENARVAERLYRKRHPQRATMECLIFAYFYLSLCEYGSLQVNRQIEGGLRATRTHNMVLGLLQMVSNIFCSMHRTNCVGYLGPPSLYLSPS